MSCARRTLAGEEARSYLATEKFSPFGAMNVSSLLGNIGASVALADRKHTDRTFKIQYGIGALLWSTSGMLLAISLCGPKIENGPPEETLSRADADLEELRRRRRSFYALHGFTTLPTLLFTLRSERPGKWWWFAGAAALPVAVDLALRSTVQEKISPWSLSAGLLPHENGLAPGLTAQIAW